MSRLLIVEKIVHQSDEFAFLMESGDSSFSPCDDELPIRANNNIWVTGFLSIGGQVSRTVAVIFLGRSLNL
jgi:hypothetical protein